MQCPKFLALSNKGTLAAKGDYGYTTPVLLETGRGFFFPPARDMSYHDVAQTP
jgi:hypothetical protein